MRKIEAARLLNVHPMCITRWCESGELKTIPGKGKCEEVDPTSLEEKRQELLGGKLAKEIKERKALEVERASEADLENLIVSLHLSPEQGDRLKATLKNFSKVKAETVLRAEQALAKQKENLLAEGNFVDISAMQAEFERVYGVFARHLRDGLQSWVAKFDLSPQQAQQMKQDYEAIMKKVFAELRSLANAPLAR